MIRHYPAFLNLFGKRAVVVGGGGIAAQKARALARCGALVTVVAPRVSPAAKRPAVRVISRRFRPGDIAGASLVVSATSDEAVNAQVSALCRRRGIWANVADRPALCDFILPAVVRRGPIVIGVSTGGASPALARHLRLRLRGFLTPRDARLARVLGRRRAELLKLSIAWRRKAVAKVLAS